MGINSTHSSHDEEQAIKRYNHQHRGNLIDHLTSIREYAATRVTSLKHPMEKPANQFKLLAMLNAQQWAFFRGLFRRMVMGIS